MILLVQPRANFHASIMPTCLHLLLFATPATLRGSWKRRCSSHFSMSSFLCQDFRSVDLWFFKNQKKRLQMSKKYQKASKFVKVQQLSKFGPWTISFNQQSIGSIQTSVRWHSAKPTSDRLSRCFHPSCQEDPMKSTFRAKGRMYSRCSWQRRKRRKAKVIPTRYSKEFFVGKTCLWYHMHMVIPCCIFKLSHVPHKSLTSFNVSNAPRSPCPAPLHQWSRKVLHWHRPDNLLANRPYHQRAAFSGPVSREDGFFRTHRIHGPGVFTWYLLTFALNLWKM